MEFKQDYICEHVMGSNPACITKFQYEYFCLDYKLKKTGVAQRQRAGLITPRSLDRNGSPVSNSSHRIGASRHWSTKTDMAQRQRAWLITTRTLDRNGLSVSNSSHRIGASRHWSTKTGMAQRKRAGLITPRTYDRNVLPVFFLHFTNNNDDYA